MFHKRLQEEEGFTLIELLIVILIIGILAAIAIPSFINQKNKANDASAKELVRSAQTAAETIGTGNSGQYGTVSLAVINAVEPNIGTSAGTNQAYLSTASGTSNSYTVAATAVSGDTFTITENAGVLTRTCANAGANTGCTNGTW